MSAPKGRRPRPVTAESVSTDDRERLALAEEVLATHNQIVELCEQVAHLQARLSRVSAAIIIARRRQLGPGLSLVTTVEASAEEGGDFRG